MCSQDLRPQMVLKSGDTVTVEMLTHHAGDDYDKMIKGDKAMEAIYEWGAKMGIDARGATGQGMDPARTGDWPTVRIHEVPVDVCC